MKGYSCKCSRCGIAIRLFEPPVMGPTVRCSKCESLYGVPAEPRGVSEAKPAKPRLPSTPRRASAPASDVQHDDVPLDADLGSLAPVDDGWAEVQRRQRKKALVGTLIAIGAIVLVAGIVMIANNANSRVKKRDGGSGDNRNTDLGRKEEQEQAPLDRVALEQGPAVLDRIQRLEEEEEPDGGKKPIRRIEVDPPQKDQAPRPADKRPAPDRPLDPPERKPELPAKNFPAIVGWSPPKELLDELGPETELGDYRIRPPRGYEQVIGAAPVAGAKMFAWTGGARQDASRPALSVSLWNMPPGEVEHSVETAHTKALTSIMSKRINWQPEPAEFGDIDGIRFMRTRWRSGWIYDKRTLQGVHYTGKVGRTYFLLGTQDIEPFHESTVPLGEAALLTLRRK